METTTRRPRLIALLAAALIAAGCATTSAPDEAPADPTETDRAVEYTVKRGDRLGDIAREFTGELALWRQIATHNGIDDPRTLREGTVLEIPAALIPRGEEAAEDNDTRPTALERVSSDTAAPSTDLPSASAGALAVRRVGGQTADDVRRESAPAVELSPVVINRRFELSPLSTELSTEPRPEAAPVPRRVRVLGSYFPKAVYAQPATYSKLLMRVAPGTLFELERETGGWYGIRLEDGVGYLRDSDAQLLESGDVERG